LSKDTPQGTATRTPLKGLIDTLMRLALRLRSSNMVPTLLSSNFLDFSFNVWFFQAWYNHRHCSII
jgi:hypothetical protein